MRRIQIPIAVLCVLTAVQSFAQEGVSYANSGAFYPGVPMQGACNMGAGFCGGFGSGGGQLYPFDQQDPWIHGQHQRVPSYGGFSSFRPYNYRHVASQSQIAQRLGVAPGMIYSQQFWNRYREGYLNQNLHSQASQNGGFPQPGNVPSPRQLTPYSTVGFPQAAPLVPPPTGMRQTNPTYYGAVAPVQPPMRVYPPGGVNR
ncbi:MAG: hypothetical protein GY758_07385 [Fuerstiella sp.]|nr:hypothetical protein [Fuerstiella sp.]MCP4783902.1 hypothetical protein [Fuerstiella sp.]MCP4857494.1 hypothetical protein [Fuerstiella sp.]